MSLLETTTSRTRTRGPEQRTTRVSFAAIWWRRSSKAVSSVRFPKA